MRRPPHRATTNTIVATVYRAAHGWAAWWETWSAEAGGWLGREITLEFGLPARPNVAEFETAVLHQQQTMRMQDRPIKIVPPLLVWIDTNSSRANDKARRKP